MGLENGQRQIASLLDDDRRGFKSTKRTETLQIKKGALKEDLPCTKLGSCTAECNVDE